MKVIYCDHCKADNATLSKLFWPDIESKKVWKEGDACPRCGYELCEADSFDEIP